MSNLRLESYRLGKSLISASDPAGLVGQVPLAELAAGFADQDQVFLDCVVAIFGSYSSGLATVTARLLFTAPSTYALGAVTYNVINKTDTTTPIVSLNMAVVGAFLNVTASVASDNYVAYGVLNTLGPSGAFT